MDKTIETLQTSKKGSEGVEDIERNINEFVIKKDLLREKLETIATEIQENLTKLPKLLQPSQSFEADILSIKNDMQNKMNHFEIKWTEELNHLKQTSTILCYEEKKKKACQNIADHLKILLTLEKGNVENMKEFSKKNSNLKKTARELISEGKELTKDIPRFTERILLCISGLESSKAELEAADKETEAQLQFQQSYLSKVEELSNLSKLLAKQILFWSSKMTNICLASSSNELNLTISKAEELKIEIKSFLSGKMKANTELSRETKSLARQIYGDDNVEPLKELEADIAENFRTMKSHMERLESLKSELINKQAEAEKTRRIKEDAERLAAQLAQQKAEAEAARLEAERKEKLKKTEELPPPRPPSPEEPRPVAPVFSSGLTDTVITEGVPCRLSAEVSGVPVPKLTWFKDGISVEKNTDYISQFQDGVCSLTIEETMKEDSANWSVRASNKAGYSESHAKLTVQEVKPVVQEFPPLFLSPLADCEAREGDPVELTCKVDGNPFPSVSWYRNGVCLDKSKNYKLTEESGCCTLRLEKIYLEDSSTFTCNIHNPHGQAVSAAKLTVQSLEPVVAPQFSRPLANIVARPGKEILLECSITGSPTPSVTWFRDNKAIRHSKEFALQFDGKTASLKVSEAFPKHAGLYVCKGHNTVGETTSTSTVYFKPNTPDLSDSETSEELRREKSKPAFYVPLSNTEAREGEDLVLECVIQANPVCEVCWYHNNTRIKPAANIRFSQEENCYKLHLASLEVSQAGDYRVVGRNSLGESSSSCNLAVKSCRTTSASSQTQQSQQSHRYTHTVTNSKAGAEPKFVSPVQGKMVKVGESLVLEGTVSGQPQPVISWYKDEKEVRTGGNLSIAVTRHHTSLTIARAGKTDAGQYRCKAENEAGTAESLADVIVNRDSSAPVFINRLTSQYLTVGQRLVMEVEVGGDPLPQLRWYFNEKEISQGQSVVLRRQGACATLVINSVQVIIPLTYNSDLI